MIEKLHCKMSKVKKKINTPNHMQNISSDRSCAKSMLFLYPVIMNDWQHHRKSIDQMCGIPDLHDQDKRVDLACVFGPPTTSLVHFITDLFCNAVKNSIKPSQTRNKM